MLYHENSTCGGLSALQHCLAREKGDAALCPSPVASLSPGGRQLSDDTIKRPRGRPRLENPKGHVLQVRCTADEYEGIEQAAADTGMEIGEYLRDRLRGSKQPRSTRVPEVDRDGLAQVLAELHELGPWLNDLARAANTGEGLPTAAELAEIRTRTDGMRAALMAALGKQSFHG